MYNHIVNGIKIIPKVHLNKYYIIIFFQIIKFFLEILSIGLILPLIFMLAKGPENLLIKLEKYLIILNIDRFYFEKNLIVILLTVLIFAFLIKFLFILYSTYFEKKCIEISNVHTSTKLFKFYINRINISVDEKNHKLIRNLTSETNNFYKIFVTGVIILISESVKLIGFFLILVFINFKTFIIVCSVLSIFTIIYLLNTKKKLITYGKKKSYISGVLIKYITEGIESVKEIKLSNNFNFFISRFQDYAIDNANVQTKFTFLQALPRQILEIVFIFAISAIIFFLALNSKNDFSDLLFILGVFVTIILKLIPSLNLLYKCLQDIFYSKETVKILSNELNKINIFNTQKGNINLSKINNDLKDLNLDSFTIKNISFSYNKEKKFIHNLNQTFKKGNTYCIYGPSGSGKSTIINLIMSFLEPDNGKILINNEIDIFENQNFWFNNISYLPQKIFLLDDNIINNVAFGVDEKNISRSRVLEVLDKVNLYKELKNFNKGLETELGNNGLVLSGGQVQRLGIARCLYSNKDLMILDEFTSSLDKDNERKIFEEFNKIKKNKIIIIISHSENIKTRCDYVLKILDGKII